eukprot:10840407-Ditylum_brightwellii.AAC.1
MDRQSLLSNFSKLQQQIRAMDEQNKTTQEDEYDNSETSEEHKKDTSDNAIPTAEAKATTTSKK